LSLYMLSFKHLSPARQAFLTIVQQKSNRQIQTVFLFLQRSNTDKTDFDYLNYKCLNESIYSDNTDLVESNNKCRFITLN
jgi:hypothetical protein